MAEVPAGAAEEPQATVDRLVAAVSTEDILFVLLEISQLRAHPAGSIDVEHSTIGRTALETALQGAESAHMSWIIKILLLAGASIQGFRSSDPTSTGSAGNLNVMSRERKGILWTWELWGDQSIEFVECKNLMALSLEDAEAWLCESDVDQPVLYAQKDEDKEEIVEKDAVPTVGGRSREASPTCSAPVSPRIDEVDNVTKTKTEERPKAVESPSPVLRPSLVHPPTDPPHPPLRHALPERPCISQLDQIYLSFPPILRIKLNNLPLKTTRGEVESLLLGTHAIPSTSFGNIWIHKLGVRCSFAFIDFTHLPDAHKILDTYRGGTRCPLSHGQDNVMKHTAEEAACPRLVLSNLPFKLMNCRTGNLELHLRKILAGSCLVEWGSYGKRQFAVVSVLDERCCVGLVRYLEENHIEMRGVQWERIPHLSETGSEGFVRSDQGLGWKVIEGRMGKRGRREDCDERCLRGWPRKTREDRNRNLTYYDP